MRQIIVDLFSFDVLGGHFALRIYGYGLMLVVGFLVGIYLARWRARRSGEDPEAVTACGMLALIGGIVGGRIAYVIQHWSDQFSRADDPLTAALNVTSGGLIYHGGLILATAMVIVYLLAKRLPVRRYLDIVAVSLLVGLAFGRAGCLLNGCCYGSQCRADWPLGMRFPMYSKPLLGFAGGPGGFSRERQDPSPVYEEQFEAGIVTPDERLCDPILRRIWPVDSLHGRLNNDQLAKLLDESTWQKDFLALAGNGVADEAKWREGLADGKGLLAGSENWTEALTHFDADRNDLIDFGEMQSYLRARRDWALSRFDADNDGTLSDGERRMANDYLQADLFALADASRSAPVKPVQLLAMVGALVMAALLSAFYRLRTREGQVFALFLIAYPLVRFIEEGLRDQNAHDLLHGVLTHNQYTAVAMAAVGVLMLLYLRRLAPSAGPTLAQRVLARKGKHGRRVAP